MNFKIINTIILIVLLFSITTVTKVSAAVTVNQLVDEFPVVTNVNVTSDIINKIRTNVSKLILDGTHRNYPGVQLAEQYNRLMWFKGAEVYSLASTIPYLDSSTKTSLTTFLQYEVNNFLLNTTYNSFEKGGDITTRIPNASLNWLYNDSTVPETMYGLWAYAYFTNDWTTIQNNWSKIQTLYSNISNNPSKVLAGKDITNFVSSPNSEIAGRVAYARIAKKLYSLTNTSSYQTTYQSTISTISSRLSSLSTQMSYTFFSGGKCGNATYIVACGRQSILEYPQFEFLTPELGRYYKDQYLTQVTSTISNAETTYPWWFMSTYNLLTLDNNVDFNTGAGGEGYFQPPLFSYEIYQAKSQILNTPITELKAKLPWVDEFASTPGYWNALNYQNMTTLIRSAETVTWTDTNIVPQSVTVNFQPVKGDFNGDSVVNNIDLSMFLANLGTSNSTNITKFDLNNSNSVDVTDLSILLTLFQ